MQSHPSSFFTPLCHMQVQCLIGYFLPATTSPRYTFLDPKLMCLSLVLVEVNAETTQLLVRSRSRQRETVQAV